MNVSPTFGRISPEEVARVREAAPIVDVVGKTVTLRDAGGGSWKGLCPFHDEKTPSFHVSEDKNLWHCFGCGEGGDVFDFIQKIEGINFPESVTQLANEYHVQLSIAEDDSEESRKWKENRRLTDANRVAAEWWHKNLMGLPSDHPAWKFLVGRGFTQEDAVQTQVGFSPQTGETLVQYLQKLKFTTQEIITAGLGIQSERGLYDRFRGRLMFPIKDPSGTHVGVGGRKLYERDNGPKYLNTPETPVYHKSNILYGLDVARKHSDAIIVVEGYTDVMACRAAGLLGAVAACGTAFGEGHVNLIRRIVGDDGTWTGSVTFVFDGDEAGQKAAVRAFELDSKFMRHTYAAVDALGQDPCEVRQREGDEGLQKLVSGKTPLAEFVLKKSLQSVATETPEEKIMAAENVAAPILARIQDPEIRIAYEKKVAGWLGVGTPRISQIVANIRTRSTSAAGDHTPGKQPQGPFGSIVYGSDMWNEYWASSFVLQFPVVAEAWRDAISPTMFTSPVLKKMWEAMTEYWLDVETLDENTGSYLAGSVFVTPDEKKLLSLLATVKLPVEDTTNETQLNKFAVETYGTLIDRYYAREEERTLAELSQINSSDADKFMVLWGQVEDFRKTREELAATTKQALSYKPTSNSIVADTEGTVDVEEPQTSSEPETHEPDPFA